MKELKKLQGFKTLSKKEQREIGGGFIFKKYCATSGNVVQVCTQYFLGPPSCFPCFSGKCEDGKCII